ncbi:MAG: tetratricopeptide repeat protein, partial [Myxococcota bacterium]|nr:tetratricopeptide repeat protein [Myxococcota bacterium]
ILVEEKRYDEAIKVLGDGAEKSGDKLSLLAEMAEIQMKTGYILEAKESMGKILTIDPGNLKIKLRFAKLLKELGHNDESAGYYKDLQEAGALKGTELLDYALVLETMNRLDESRNFAQQVLDKDPQNLKANVLMGSLQVRSKEYASAKKVLERALGIDNHNSRAHYFLGVNELNQGNLEEATKMLVQAKSLNQDDLQIRQQLAEALAQSEGKGESRRLALLELDYIIETYKKNSEGIDKIRQDPEVYLRRGQLHFRGSDLTKALADFKTAMQLDSSRQDVILEFASTLRARGRHADAAPYFKEVLRGDPKNATAHYNLARIAMKNRDVDGAEKHFKRAADNGGSQFPDAHRYLGYLYKDRSLKVPACSNFKAYLALKHKNADREEIARLINSYCR